MAYKHSWRILIKLACYCNSNNFVWALEHQPGHSSYQKPWSRARHSLELVNLKIALWLIEYPSNTSWSLCLLPWNKIWGHPLRRLFYLSLSMALTIKPGQPPIGCWTCPLYFVESLKTNPMNADQYLVSPLTTCDLLSSSTIIELVETLDCLFHLFRLLGSYFLSNSHN